MRPRTRRPCWRKRRSDRSRAGLAVRAQATTGIRLLGARERRGSASFPATAAISRFRSRRSRGAAGLCRTGVVLDGEVVVVDDARHPELPSCFRNAAGRAAAIEIRRSSSCPATHLRFDLLACRGYDVRPLPLRGARQLLASSCRRLARFATPTTSNGKGRRSTNGRSRLGLEGIVGEACDSPYARRPAQSRLAQGTGRREADDFAMVGFLRGRGSRRKLGSLMLAWNDKGRLVYAGTSAPG